MRTVTVYYAYDGTEFYDSEECKEYERPAMYHINQWNRCCSFFDNDMNLIYLPAGLDVEEALDWFNKMLEECQYIKINEKIPADSLDFLIETIGYYLPENEVGLYRYNYATEEWVSID